MHDRLETETIHASILRHKLQFLPAQIREEIKAAVLSARQLNASAQNEMQDKLDSIQRSMTDLADHQHELERENAKLQYVIVYMYIFKLYVNFYDKVCEIKFILKMGKPIKNMIMMIEFFVYQ